jgi:hypothetical protein
MNVHSNWPLTKLSLRYEVLSYVNYYQIVTIVKKDRLLNLTMHMAFKHPVNKD